MVDCLETAPGTDLLRRDPSACADGIQIWATESAIAGPLIMEGAVDKIVRANIDRFNLLLKTETDPTKRAMIIRLLAEERTKQLPTAEAKEA